LRGHTGRTYGLHVKPGLLERLQDGPVVCAEGYLFECERLGYLQAGAFVPEVVLEHPEVVAQLHRQFVHAGSDVVEAFTYYAHREKLRLVGREGDLEPFNRQALAIAGEVAGETGALLAGNVCNTNAFLPEEAARRDVRAMFDEQIGWAVDAGVDFVIGETFSWAEEAAIALEAIKETGLPAVITLAMHQEPVTRDGLTPADACRTLEDAGAAVVGLNCIRGPRTLMPMVRAVREACSGYVAALPVPYRTTEEQPSFQSLRDPDYDPPGGRPFPTALDPFVCTRYELGDFAREALELGVTYLGVCCGAGPHHIRAVAEAIGRTPPASRYSPDMSKHAFLGTDESLKPEYQEYAERL
jgi:betaine-homocysteine S-methyltransferase